MKGKNQKQVVPLSPSSSDVSCSRNLGTRLFVSKKTLKKDRESVTVSNLENVSLQNHLEDKSAVAGASESITRRP